MFADAVLVKLYCATHFSISSRITLAIFSLTGQIPPLGSCSGVQPSRCPFGRYLLRLLDVVHNDKKGGCSRSHKKYPPLAYIDNLSCYAG